MKSHKHIRNLLVIALAATVMTGTGMTAFAASSGTVTTAATTAVSSSKLTSTSSLSSSAITLGQTVTISGAANGGSGSYQYTYCYKKSTDTAWKVIKGYSTTKSVSLKPTAAGTYDVCVKVKDSTNTVAKTHLTLKVNAAVTNKSTMSKTDITLGQSVTLKGAATGGTGAYQYTYCYKKSTSSTWTTIKGYSSTASVVLTPKNATAYDVCIKVKDASGYVAKKDFQLNVAAGLTVKSTVKESITKGQSLKLTGAATGGSGSYQYAFYYKKTTDSGWKTGQAFSTEKTCTITPAYAADYDICIKVKDASGQTAKKYFVVNVAPALVNQSTISSTTIAPGQKIKISAAASGGSGSYTYAYTYKKSTDSAWTTAADYGDHSTLEMTLVAEGTYTFYAKVKDSNGQVTKKSFTVKVADSSRNAEIDEILDEIITNDMTELKKVKAIHDWIVCNIEYDTDIYTTDVIPDSDFTYEGALATRKAVCDGYSKLFLQMAKQAGLEALRLTGTAQPSYSSNAEGHAWNQVKVAGEWYNIDVTWDDPIIMGVTDNSNLSYDYFLIPDSIIEQDHFCDYSSKLVRHKCTAPQPIDGIIDEEIDKELAAHSNYIYADAATVQTEISKAVKSGIKDLYVIYYRPNSSQSAAANEILGKCPYGYQIGLSIMKWRFNDYYFVHLTFT